MDKYAIFSNVRSEIWIYWPLDVAEYIDSLGHNKIGPVLGTDMSSSILSSEILPWGLEFHIEFIFGTKLIEFTNFDQFEEMTTKRTLLTSPHS